MCRMGDWRNDKDEELELDGIGGVNILVKADVHRSGLWAVILMVTTQLTESHRNKLPLLSV